ncbi:MAG: ferritin-like domain-containing protein [Ilumatobacteraceae bacterium]
MDLQSAEPANSRRRLLGALGAAGLASAAALSISRPASAAPSSPTDADKDLLRQAMQLELTARDLYEEAAGAGLSDEATALAEVFATNHAAYADKIAGTSGFSANTRNDEVYDDLEAAFAGSNDAAFVEAAMSLENTAAATHASLLGDYESTSARTLTASIAVVEARMATVLAEFGGLAANLDELFEPDAEALTLTGGEA